MLIQDLNFRVGRESETKVFFCLALYVFIPRLLKQKFCME